MFLQNKKIQNRLTRVITKELSENLGSRLSIKEVSITFFNRFQMKDVYLEDLNGDTLLFSDRVKVTLNRFNGQEKEIGIRRITLKNADIHLISTDTTGVNLNFIIDKIRNPDKHESEKWELTFHDIQLVDSRFRFTDPYKDEMGTPVDYTAMDLKDLNLEVSDLVKRTDTVDFQINELSFVEKSGFKVEKLSSKVSLGKHHMYYDNVYVETLQSNVSANNIYFNFNSYRDFSDFTTSVEIYFNFRSSSVNFHDISYFARGLNDFNERFRVSGVVEGMISDMSADEILIAYNDHTILGGSMNIYGLPAFSETFVHFNIDRFQTHVIDLQNIQFPGNKKLNIPDNFQRLGTITYRGKFTGYYDDFVAYGNFGTDLGSISTDILLKPGSQGKLNFEGNLQTESFALGEIIPENDFIGNISISADVDGAFDKKTVSADLQGKIGHFELYGYEYKNIDLEGFLTDQTFDGSLEVSDPNILMQFEGKVDFSREQPQFNFIADVGRLRPYYLNLNKTDPSYFASFFLESNFTGIHPDSINGEINLVNSFFQHSGDQIQIYDLNLLAENSGDSSSLQIRSEVMDADVYGHFHYSDILSSLTNFAGHYLPSVTEDSVAASEIYMDESEFEFSLRFKQIENVIRFFTRDYFLSDQSSISGRYEPGNYDFSIVADIPAIGYKENYWTDLFLTTESDSSHLSYTGVSNYLTLNKELGIENFALSGDLYHDTITTGITWNSSKAPDYRGNLNLQAELSNNLKSGNKRINIDIIPSYIVFNDTLWNISTSHILVDSTAIMVDSFIIRNQNQALVLNGEVSQESGSRLAVNLSKLNLETLNIFTNQINLNLGGSVSGQATLVNAYKNPAFLSDLIMTDLIINDQDFGEGNLRALWNNENKGIHMLATAVKGDTKILEIEGEYFPQERNIDFEVDFEKIRLSAFESFTDRIFTDLKGLGDGNLRIEGTVNKPVLNGELSLFKASMVLDYLQTRYSFNDTVSVIDNNIVLDDFQFTDESGNKAVLNGKITNKYFRDFYLNLNASTGNLMFLNTNRADNELFYGKVHASAIIDISGPPDNLYMKINAETKKNSIFYIPLNRAEEVNTNDFILFTNSSGEEIVQRKEEYTYNVNLKGLTMDFNLQITPDAEVQIIFDPTVGDVLRGKGTGNITMSINTLGNFEMYGDMIIEKGDYLFTLENLINKKLEVEPGGTITWNGDPADAIVDLNAVYKLRTSVSTLSPEAGNTLNKRIPVECQITMTGKLLKPNIQTDIILPTADQQTRNIVQNSINTEEEKLKQFISLLVMNNFMSINPGDAFLSGSVVGNTASVAGVATSELLLHQVNQLLSQVSQDFDVGLNYRPGDQITSQELEVALSTQILDDRITINGNLDVGGSELTQTSAATNTNNIVGDFDIDFQLTENGKLHLKAFNRANDDFFLNTSPYTQGVGVFYREEFNTLGDLFRRYREALLRLFSRNNKVEEEEETTMND